MAAWCSSTCATAPASSSWCSTPTRGQAHAAAHELRNEFVVQAEGVVDAALGRDGQPEAADRRGRDPRRPAAGAGGGVGAAVPARRGERGRVAAAAPPLPRPAPRRDAPQPAHALPADPDHPPAHGGQRVLGAGDADPLQVHARGSQGVPGADLQPARPVLRAAAVAADVQAAVRDRRLRALLPDRPLLPGRGHARRPHTGVHAARHRDGVPRARRAVRPDGDAVRAHLERAAGRRAGRRRFAHDLGRGHPPLRLRQARPALRRRDLGRHRPAGRHRVQGLPRRGGRRRGGARAWPCPVRIEFSRKDFDDLVEFAKGWGGKGVAWLQLQAGGEIRSPIAKFLSQDELAAIVERIGAVRGRHRLPGGRRGGGGGARAGAAAPAPGRAAGADRRRLAVRLGDRLPDVRVAARRGPLEGLAQPVLGARARLGGGSATIPPRPAPTSTTWC